MELEQGRKRAAVGQKLAHALFPARRLGGARQDLRHAYTASRAHSCSASKRSMKLVSSSRLLTRQSYEKSGSTRPHSSRRRTVARPDPQRCSIVSTAAPEPREILLPRCCSIFS